MTISGSKFVLHCIPKYQNLYLTENLFLPIYFRARTLLARVSSLKENLHNLPSTGTSTNQNPSSSQSATKDEVDSIPFGTVENEIVILD